MAVALGLNVKVMIAAEVLSQPARGIGTMFQIERARLNTPGVFAWCAIVVGIAATLDSILAVATRDRVGRAA
jgi:NitT/TauT family transport system permease protein